MLKICSVRPADDEMSPEAGRETERGRTLQRKNLLLRVHDSRVGRDRPPHKVVGICQVDDDDLVLLIDLLSHTYEVITLKSQVL